MPDRPAVLESPAPLVPWGAGKPAAAGDAPIGEPSSALPAVARRWWRILARDWPHLRRSDRLALRQLVEVMALRMDAERKMGEAGAQFVRARGEWKPSGLYRMVHELRRTEVVLIRDLGGTPLTRRELRP